MTESTDNREARHILAGGFSPWLLLIGVPLLVILVDQASKAYAVAHLALYESWMPFDLLEPLFRFTLVRNTGAAFGLFPQGGSVFLIVAIVVSVVITYYYRQMPSGAWLTRLALGLQLGGALGNVIDRIRLGYVVDFFHVEYWPVFNVADSCIVIGVTLLAFEMLRQEHQEARRRGLSGEEPSGQDASLDTPGGKAISR
ncbi:MAG TPA: signal peptidase II [Aggregatilineaceae bacterium]|nr:signal peptidase II [Aggregatilineaceae bacterium]